MSRDKLRGRFVDDVLGEIKRVALLQVAAGGAAALSLNAIARELEVSGPALYRYVGSREDLVNALIAEAYDELGAATAVAVAARRTPQTRLIAFVRAYRGWALAQPHRYGLLFDVPRPGYDPNADALLPSAQALMNVLIGALARPVPRPTRNPLGVEDWLRRRGLAPDLAPDLAPFAADAVIVWSRLHGLVSLELAGAFTSMALDTDALYAREFDLTRLA